MADMELWRVILIMIAMFAPFLVAAVKNRFDIGLAALFICLIASKIGGAYVTLAISALFCAYLFLSPDSEDQT